MYKPRDTNHIGLSQIRVLGTSAFGGNIKTQALDLNDDESHCKYSLGWLRLLHHCITLGNEYNLTKAIVSSAANVTNLLRTCCGLLLVPSHIPTLYLSNLENVLRELTLYNRANSLQAIKILLRCKPHVSEPINLIQQQQQQQQLTNAAATSTTSSSSTTNNYTTSSLTTTTTATPSNYNRFLMNSPTSQTVCELLYQVCRYRDDDTSYRITILIDWLRKVTNRSLRDGNTDSCTPSYINCIAYVIWSWINDDNGDGNEDVTIVINELRRIFTIDLFDSIYDLVRISNENVTLKYSLDAILCSLCYCKNEFFPLLLKKMDVSKTTDHLSSSISDDRKERLKDNNLLMMAGDRLAIRNLYELYLTEEQLETIALVSRSPTAIEQLLDSGLPALLCHAIIEFCRGNPYNYKMAELDKCKAILKFFADVSEEKLMRDWLGTYESSTFWSPLLNYLCNEFNDVNEMTRVNDDSCDANRAKTNSTETSTTTTSKSKSTRTPSSTPAPTTTTKRTSQLKSESRAQLEETCVKFLSKCCLCHHDNQLLLSRVLCEVIRKQTNGITGFMRRLILQLLLENEKVPVSVTSDESAIYYYKSAANNNLHHRFNGQFMPVHPTFNQTSNKALMYLGTNLTLADILDQYVAFSNCNGNGVTLKQEKNKHHHHSNANGNNNNNNNNIGNGGNAKKELSLSSSSASIASAIASSKIDFKSLYSMALADSDLSISAGVTAKDKRLKDAKNQNIVAPKLKKKRYTISECSTASVDILEGKVIRCDNLPYKNLSFNLTLAQVLKMIEEHGRTQDWPCIHLTISQNKGKFKVVKKNNVF